MKSYSIKKILLSHVLLLCVLSSSGEIIQDLSIMNAEANEASSVAKTSQQKMTSKEAALNKKIKSQDSLIKSLQTKLSKELAALKKKSSEKDLQIKSSLDKFNKSKTEAEKLAKEKASALNEYFKKISGMTILIADQKTNLQEKQAELIKLSENADLAKKQSATSNKEASNKLAAAEKQYIDNKKLLDMQLDLLNKSIKELQ
ncbi:MAG: hypothetical protein EOM55_05530, partial [Clostridia bacterium]|nr:hypothetical protein [Clostridia bacterium]